MKKIALLLSLVILSACSPVPPQQNNNIVIEPLPAFLDMNANSNFFISPEDNTNAGIIVNNNENIAAIGNENENIPPRDTANNLRELNVALLVPHEVAFDCQPLGIYEQMDFYNTFIDHFESLYRYSTTDMKNMIALSLKDTGATTVSRKAVMKESRDHISSSCLAKDNSLFIVIAEGDKDGYGFKIVRYQPERDLLEVASREDEQRGTTWPVVPASFGRRTASSLSLTASKKTDERTISMTYEYNYVTNHIATSQFCSSGKCGPYSY